MRAAVALLQWRLPASLRSFQAPPAGSSHKSQCRTGTPWPRRTTGRHRSSNTCSGRPRATTRRCNGRAIPDRAALRPRSDHRQDSPRCRFAANCHNSLKPETARGEWEQGIAGESVCVDSERKRPVGVSAGGDCSAERKRAGACTAVVAPGVRQLPAQVVRHLLATGRTFVRKCFLSPDLRRFR